MFKVFLLSVLQGVAEFLPISSSGHLVLGQELLGVNATGVRLDVALHVGTLISICIFYRAVIRRIRMQRDWRYVVRIFVSALPAVAVYLFGHGRLEAAFESVRTVGLALVFTGGMLIASKLFRPGTNAVTGANALWMGMFQAVALIPGVSRSGMTLIAARSAGIQPESGAEFSFLMSAPLIFGAAMMELAKSLTASAPASDEVSWTLCAFGAAVAALVGYWSLMMLLRTLQCDRFWLFGPYCLATGVAAWLLA